MTDLTPPPPPLPEPSAPSIQPIEGVGSVVESLLRQPARLVHGFKPGLLRRVLVGLLLLLLLGAAVYGLVMGSFSGGPQLWAAPAKLLVGLVLSALICLPSLYIFGCLCGSSARLVDVIGLVAASSALISVLLLGFAPVAWIFSQSTASLVAMSSVHLGFWLVATLFGLRFLHTGFQQLSARGSGILKVWMAIYVLVALQMATALRPLVGTAPTLLPQEKKFFLSHWADCLDQKASANRH